MQLKDYHNTYFICATQYTNLGDLIINKMLVDELSKYGKIYLDDYNVPLDFKKPLLENPGIVDTAEIGLTIKSPSVKSFFRFLKLIKTERISFLTRSPGPLEEPSLIVRLALSIINIVVRLLGVRVIYFGNCCSEACANISKIKTTYMNAVYVRSIESEVYAKQNLKCRVGFIPDMAFLLNDGKRECPKKPIVAIDFRSVSDNPDGLMSDIKNNVRKFLIKGYSVELFYQVKGDKTYVEQIYQEIKQEGVSIHDEIIWYDEISYYADKSFVCSNRLHSLLLGAMYGAIPLARITQDPRLSKVKHVFESSLSKEFYHTITIDTPLCIDNLVDKQDSLRALLRQDVSRNSELVKETIRIELNAN